MKTLLSLVVLVALVFASAASAQSNTDVLSSVDTPNNTVQHVSMVHLWGWAFSCSSGQQPFAVHVSYLDAMGNATPLSATAGIVWRQSRADVKSAFVPWCPELGTYTGWAIDIRGGMPTGTITLRIDWQDRYGEKSDYVTLCLE
jgi:hypothetical protein